MATQVQTHGTGGQRAPGAWRRGLALSMIAVALILVLVVANQIGGILIARDLRDQYQQLVTDVQAQAGRPAPAAAAEPAPAEAARGTAGVIPDLVDKADLEPAPSSEVHVAVAPDVPPAGERTTQAIVDVAFEVVENVSTIDPASGTRHETWGYRLVDGPERPRGRHARTGDPGPRR